MRSFLAVFGQILGEKDRMRPAEILGHRYAPSHFISQVLEGIAQYARNIRPIAAKGGERKEVHLLEGIVLLEVLKLLHRQSPFNGH